MKKRLWKTIIILIILLRAGSQTAWAETNGYGAGQGRMDAVNINDYSTSSWDRFEYNYEFVSGVDYGEELGTPTQTDIVPRNEETENERRNKDVSFDPPPYGVFSGEFDTDRSNDYITIKNYNYTRNTTSSIGSATYDTLSYGVNGAASDTGVLASTSVMSGSSDTSSNASYASSAVSGGSGNVTISTSSFTGSKYSELNTQALEYSDGSIGRLAIPAIDVDVNVYEGENLSNLQKGVGHFAFTSAWSGNVGFAGHNGGSAGYFENLKKLSIGDTIIYETKYGKRTYEVTSKVIISDTDYSTLGWSSENQLTLITCNKGVANERLSVTATEV